jgi:hypothetical protein
MLAVYGDERDEIPASALAVAFEYKLPAPLFTASHTTSG